MLTTTVTPPQLAGGQLAQHLRMRVRRRACRHVARRHSIMDGLLRESSLALANHVARTRLGVVTTAEAGFQLAHDPDTVRAPDVAFVRADEFRRRRERVFPGAPGPCRGSRFRRAIARAKSRRRCKIGFRPAVRWFGSSIPKSGRSPSIAAARRCHFDHGRHAHRRRRAAGFSMPVAEVFA